MLPYFAKGKGSFADVVVGDVERARSGWKSQGMLMGKTPPTAASLKDGRGIPGARNMLLERLERHRTRSSPGASRKDLSV